MWITWNGADNLKKIIIRNYFHLLAGRFTKYKTDFYLFLFIVNLQEAMECPFSQMSYGTEVVDLPKVNIRNL